MIVKDIKKIALKFFILIFIVIALNFLYKYTFFENDIQKHSDIINIVKKAINESPEVIYVGESSNITSSDYDLDKRYISDFISDFYPKIKFGNITKEASHAGIYYELLRNIPENSSVKTVIVTLNLRSFDANWIYSNLETSLQKSILLLKDYPPLFNRFLMAFKGYDIKTEKEREKQFLSKWENDTLLFPKPFVYKNVVEWDKGMFDKGIKDTNGNKDFSLTELACHFIKTYAFQIDTNSNPRIKDFDKIVELAKKRNWNLVFNLLAENTEKAELLVGPELLYLINQNRDLLIKRYNKNNVIVVDNLTDVPSDEYIDQNWTTEHYAEKGRKIIAENVADSLKKIYLKDFVNISYDYNIDSVFNDCEGKTIWGQMQSLSMDFAFSGKQSSKTGQGQDYSIAFVCPISKLRDSLKYIQVDLQVFQEGTNHDAKLVIELSGKDIEKQWNGYLVTDYVKCCNKWSKLCYNFKVLDDFYKYNIIKILIFNPTSTIIYIDDFKIKFNK